MLIGMCAQVPKVRWSDVGGLEGVKQGLKEAVQWPHLHPDALTRLGAQPPRGTFTLALLLAPPIPQCLHAKECIRAKQDLAVCRCCKTRSELCWLAAIMWGLCCLSVASASDASVHILCWLLVSRQ